MGKPTGFLERDRALPPRRPVDERVQDFREVETRLPVENAREQASRCMACGVPFCHSGCPLGNVIPEWNHEVYQDEWRAAAEALFATNNFPEITGRVCPAPCEAGCVLQLENSPVTIKRIEGAIADRALEEGWVEPRPPKALTGKRVAVVGSGPAGLAAAQQLGRAGHEVTVFERDDCIGGLLRYGIPDFKMEKSIIDRRVVQMEAEGVSFRTGVEVGADLSLSALRDQHDAVVLAIGATKARDLPIEGRELEGVHLAMDFLVPQNRAVADGLPALPNAQGLRVVVLGGGDTGSDCLGTAIRQGAASVTQIELMPQPGGDDPDAWPEWPMVFRTSSSQEEGGDRQWSILTKRFLGDEGRVTGLDAVRVTWEDGQLRESEERVVIEADLVLLALGFVGPDLSRLTEGDVEVPRDGRGNLVADTERFQTSLEGVFACGDARRGQSLVVWAIWEGRQAAHAVDVFLMGESVLPTSPLD
ncbi:MAG: glutamate synthase [Deltaproteobacteria bacterium]|nr:MAG: glutamate synthase [Deltaproteobacteria bacterium]